ncbi:MAG: hypothetical protein ACLUD0_05705 [Eubacterium ramulus]
MILPKCRLSSEDWLYRLFGIDAELLDLTMPGEWSHFAGLQDIKSISQQICSLSNGQVLMRNYAFEEALVVVTRKWRDVCCHWDLMMDKGLVTDSITLRISCDHLTSGFPDTGGTVNLKKQSNNSGLIIQNVEQLYSGNHRYCYRDPADQYYSKSCVYPESRPAV